MTTKDVVHLSATGFALIKLKEGPFIPPEKGHEDIKYVGITLGQ